MTTRAPDMPEKGRRPGRVAGYEILGIIGTGTIATAYHARQIAMDREVALKILHPRLAADPVFVRAYMAEAQAVSRFHHPHIVQGFDAGESGGYHYFAHEYLPGGSIADRLRRGGDAARFSETRLLTYLRQTTSALKHAWSATIHHGDLNPANLLLDAQRNIKLANLGVPRTAGLRAAGNRNSDASPGFVRAGPDYAAPEQLDNPGLVNAATDIYSLGATFYHISFGVPPFRPPAGGDIAAFRKANPVPAFSLERQEGFSGNYLRLIHDMLACDPARRPADPEALEERLERFHTAPAEESLALRVRQVTAPPSLSSRRRARRSAVSATPPCAIAGERPFSLARRAACAEAGRDMVWMGLACVAAACAAVLGLVLKG